MTSLKDKAMAIFEAMAKSHNRSAESHRTIPTEWTATLISRARFYQDNMTDFQQHVKDCDDATAIRLALACAFGEGMEFGLRYSQTYGLPDWFIEGERAEP